MVASSDEHFREMVRDSIINLPETKIVSEFTEVAANLYIRVLQDLERHPHAGLIVDISGDPEGSPGLHNTGSILAVNADGAFTPLVTGLDQPTSLEFIGNTAFVVTFTGEVWRFADPPLLTLSPKQLERSDRRGYPHRQTNQRIHAALFLSALTRSHS
jgi:hypothetical protein